jgi:SAM-dependent methyltransferase
VRCPLCDETEALVVVGATPYETIWSELSKEGHGQWSSDVRDKNSPTKETTLVRCGTCDLRFFWPLAPGESSFYAELTAGQYFTDKWEFGWALDRLPRDSLVLDTGCGRGDFLARCRAKGHRIVGVETDAKAALLARSQGIEVHEGPVASFALGAHGRFDVACAFHVIEHVADPLAFVRGLVACAKPGGLIVVSVPNDERTWRPMVEPLDFPPHHVTRWTKRSLEMLANRAGLAMGELETEPMPWETARHSLEKKIHQRVGGGVGAVAGFLASRGLLPSKRLYRALDVSRRAGWSGLSLVFAMRSP